MVVFHWGNLLLSSPSFEIVFWCCCLPFMSSSIEVIFHWGHLPLIFYTLLTLSVWWGGWCGVKDIKAKLSSISTEITSWSWAWQKATPYLAWRRAINILIPFGLIAVSLIEIITCHIITTAMSEKIMVYTFKSFFVALVFSSRWWGWQLHLPVHGTS